MTSILGEDEGHLFRTHGYHAELQAEWSSSGSHSKTQMLLALMFGGKMRYDIRRPEYRFSDRFILAAGHTIPMVDAVLAMIGDAFRLRFTDTGDQRFFIAPEKIVLPEDLLRFRHRGGLPGHAEFGGKTMFLKFNTVHRLTVYQPPWEKH